ncbi:MAG: amidohydrolase family protein [Phycisphaerales bacterium]|nr:amidohydrolase family protein [Phycisphaerales bacterium]
MMRLITCLLAIVLGTTASAETILVYGDTVHTMAGDHIVDGYVLVRDGRIAAVGHSDEYTADGTETVLHAPVVTPGLVDARTCVGLAGHLNYDHDRDELDGSGPLQPELRALDAYNPRERLVEWVRGFGVTTMHTGHAPISLISGQTMIVKTTGNRVEDAVIRPVAMISCSLSDTAIDGDSPGTRAKAAAMLRQRLLDAQQYLREQAEADGEEDEDRQPPRRDLVLESLAGVLKGETPLLIHADRSRDIANALRIREEFNIPIVLDGATEAYVLLDDIKASGVPVFIHPTMVRPYGEHENLSFETASKLVKAGVPVAMQSGYESYVPRTRVVLYEAGMAAANGCSFDDALAMITIKPAKILGIDDRVGSIEVGKDADLALYDGDPFEWTSHCTGVVIDGAIMSSEPR